MKRTYTIMTGNLGRGFEADFAREYRERLVNAFRCEVADGRMQPIDVALKDGSGSAPRRHWEADPDEDVIREIAEHEYNLLVAEYNEEPWGYEAHDYDICDPGFCAVDDETAHEDLPIQVPSFR